MPIGLCRLNKVHTCAAICPSWQAKCKSWRVYVVMRFQDTARSVKDQSMVCGLSELSVNITPVFALWLNVLGPLRQTRADAHAAILGVILTCRQ